MKKTIVLSEYKILKPFRLGGRLITPKEETVKLAKQQVPFLLRSGKIEAVAEKPATKTTTKKSEVSNG